MPPAQTTATTGPKADKEGYYRLGRTTLTFLLVKYGFPAVILFVIELILLGASAGGNALPPFSQWVSHDPVARLIVGFAAEVVPGLIVVSILVAVVMAYTFYWSFRYKLEDNDLSFEKGIVGIQEISVPYRQIQNVDIEQSVFYRIFDLADLVILTAGHEDPIHAPKNETEIVMPALNRNEARRLQQFLLDRANIQRAVSVSASSELPVPPPLS